MRNAICMCLAVLVALAAGVGQGHSPSSIYMQQAIASNRTEYTPDVYILPQGAEQIVRSPRRGGPYHMDFRRVARAEATRAGIRRPNLFVRQMAAESGFQPCAGSPAGAIGIAQIMPATADSWGVDPYMPRQALRAAAEHMATYEKQLGSYEVALAAYNAGPGAVQKYGGVPPYPETRTYISRVMGNYPLAGMRQVYNLPGGETTRFHRQLRLMLARARSHGSRITIENSWRSYGKQASLWKQKVAKVGWRDARKWVAPPGCSNHNRGIAADLSGDLALAHRLAPKYGLKFPMSHEPWHVELA